MRWRFNRQAVSRYNRHILSDLTPFLALFKASLNRGVSILTNSTFKYANALHILMGTPVGGRAGNKCIYVGRGAAGSEVHFLGLGTLIPPKFHHILLSNWQLTI